MHPLTQARSALGNMRWWIQQHTFDLIIKLFFVSISAHCRFHNTGLKNGQSILNLLLILKNCAIDVTEELLAQSVQLLHNMSKFLTKLL